MKRLLASLLCMLILSGCSLKTGIDLMQLPKPNKDRQAITDELERVRSQTRLRMRPMRARTGIPCRWWIWTLTAQRRSWHSSGLRPMAIPMRRWCCPKTQMALTGLSAGSRARVRGLTRSAIRSSPRMGGDASF